MDYAGTRPASDPIHRRLAALNAGDRVMLHLEGAGSQVRDAVGNCVAKLSSAASNRLLALQGRAAQASVVAMIQRDRNDPASVFIDGIRVDRWEVPILEVSWLEGEGKDKEGCRRLDCRKS
jgi:ATP-dependent DNA helicase RecQ